jgi:hypothetical protein
MYPCDDIVVVELGTADLLDTLLTRDRLVAGRVGDPGFVDCAGKETAKRILIPLQVQRRRRDSRVSVGLAAAR